MKKLTFFQGKIIVGIIGFIAFQFLSIHEGQEGDIGYAIGFATLSLSYIIILCMGIVLEKINEKNDETYNR
jgi:hypothetical protein